MQGHIQEISKLPDAIPWVTASLEEIDSPARMGGRQKKERKPERVCGHVCGVDAPLIYRRLLPWVCA